MDAIRIYTTIEEDGEIHLANLPVKRGQRVEMIVLPEPTAAIQRPPLTAADLLASGLVGLWEGREDITDSAVFARQLRDQAQHRQHA
ncbi:MAG: hypothetical protein M3R61_01290 [Chloroflexota bacterium]|nr:hypothetical protein [Chloroflexota bacterium]